MPDENKKPANQDDTLSERRPLRRSDLPLPRPVPKKQSPSPAPPKQDDEDADRWGEATRRERPQKG